MKQHYSSISIAVVTLFVYFLTVLPATRAHVNSLFLLYVFVAAVGIAYWPFARQSIKHESIYTAYFFAVFISILLWIGVTGWFFSPFFYLLYLLAVLVAFMYSPFATLLFVIVLIGLFAPNVGSIDITVDLITLITLISVVPLTHFLQKEYLQLKQTQKKVLILEEKSNDLKNKVEEVLMNKVVKFSVDLREPVNDMRQYALHAIRTKSAQKRKDALHKIVVLGQESLDQIESFEFDVTGKKLLHSNGKKKSTRKKKSSRKK